jgi:hypothetical protein
MQNLLLAKLSFSVGEIGTNAEQPNANNDFDTSIAGH